MLGQKQYLASESVEDRPVVFLLVEERTPFIESLEKYFVDCGLDPRSLLLSSFENANQLTEQCRVIKELEVYKLLVVGGFKTTYIEKSELLLQVIRALELAFVEDGRVLSVFFLLNYSRPLSPINFEFPSHEIFWSEQKIFLNRVLKTFPLAQFCLIEDYLDLEFDFNLRYNLFFGPFKQQLILDSQDDCYWQTQDGFLKNFKTLFFQSKVNGKFLLRGKKENSTVFLAVAKNLCSRYFLQEFSVLKLFIKSVEENKLLADFVKIYHLDKLVSKIIDEKLRQLPLSLNPGLQLDKDSLQALKEQKRVQALSSSIIQQKQVVKPEKAAKKPLELVKKKVDGDGLKSNLQKDKKTKSIEKDLVEEKIDKSINIDKKLQNIFRQEQQDRRSQRFEKNLKGARKIVKKSKRRRLSFYFGFFLASVGIVVLFLFANFFLSQKSFEKDLLSFIQASLTDSDETLVAFKNERKHQFFKWQLDNYRSFVSEDYLSTPNNYWMIFEQLKKQEILNDELQNSAFQLYQAILKTDGEPAAEWLDYLTKSRELYQFKQELSELLDGLNPDILAKDQAKFLVEYKTKNIKEMRMQQRVIVFLEALSEFLLSPARSNLVILVQDSNELRSSGGFLVSLVTLSFENSRLLNWQVYDIADLDSRIYGDKLASEELRSLFVTKELLLRDANWPANFSEASNDISWFIEQSLSLKPDLILTLGSKELYDFSISLFPLEVDEFSINQNNFFDELLRQNHVSFTKVVNVIFQRLLGISSKEMSQIFEQLILALESREVLINSSSELLSKIIKNNLWSGELLETPCPSEFASVGDFCFSDGIFQLENNVGLNKVNRLITQEIDHSLGISENFIRHKRVMNFENLSRQNFWPEGNYQTYLKFYLPKSANLEKFTLNDVDVDRSVYKWFEEGGRRVLAYKFTVPVLSSAVLEFVYLIPHELRPPFSYVFLDQKQAGIFNKETNYKVLFAEDFQPSLIAPQAKYDNKVIQFSNNNQDNFLFAVAF